MDRPGRIHGDTVTDTLTAVRARCLYFYARSTGRAACTLGPSSLAKLLDLDPDTMSSTLLPILACLPSGVQARWRNGRLSIAFPGPSVCEADIKSVFQHWQRVLGKDRHRLTQKRRKAVSARLRDGFTVQQLCRAIDGMAHDPFHNPKPGTGQRAWNDLELVCRDADHVEKFQDAPVSGGESLAQRIRKQRR